MIKHKAYFLYVVMLFQQIICKFKSYFILSQANGVANGMQISELFHPDYALHMQRRVESTSKSI